MPKLSIIIPVYNVEKYVERAVKSALLQGDCEVVVIDDGSTDNSGSICDSLSSDRVRVIHTQNGGLSAARNRGLSEATGEYVCFIDSDDYLDNGAGKYMLSLAKEKGADIVICGFYTEYEGKEPIAHAPQSFVGNAFEIGEHFINLKRTHLFDSACNKLYKRSFLSENSLTFLEGEIFEDTEFNLRAFSQNPVLAISDKCFYHYVQRMTGSITKTYNSEKKKTILSRAEALRAFCEAHCKEAVGYCGIFYLKSLFSSVADTFLPSAQVDSRRAIIKQSIKEDGYIRALKNAKPSGAEKLIWLVAKLKNVTVIYLFCLLVYLFKYRIKPII